MKKLIQAFFCVLLLLALAGCNDDQAITPSGNTVTIGVIGPMSGPKKIIGETGLLGIQTALHIYPYLNNGDRIKLLVEDDQNQPELTLKALKKIARSGGVSAILLLSTSGSALAVNNIADDYQIPILALVASHPDISKDKKFVSQICFDNTIQGKVAALFVRDELLIDRVAVFENPDSFHSTSLADEFIHTFHSVEGLIVELIPITAGSNNYKEILERLRDQNVQLIYMPVAVDNVIAISKALKQIKWAPKTMTGDGTFAKLKNQLGKKLSLVEGLFTIDLYSDNLQKSSFGEKAAKLYSSLFDINPTGYTMVGFEGSIILGEALDRCHDPADRACVNQMIRLTKNFDGIVGKITIMSNGKAWRPLIVSRIRKNRTEFVVKVY